MVSSNALHQSEVRENIHGIGQTQPARNNSLVIIPDAVTDPTAVRRLIDVFSSDLRVYCFSPKDLDTQAQCTAEEVLARTRELARELNSVHQIKRANILGIGSGAFVAQALSFLYPKIVRRLILVNAQCSPQFSLAGRVINFVDRFFPAGLPFAANAIDFDPRSSLHRVRCPVLVVVSRHADPYLKKDAQLLVRKIPNSWVRELDLPGGNTAPESSTALEGVIREFLEIPVKCAQ